MIHAEQLIKKHYSKFKGSILLDSAFIRSRSGPVVLSVFSPV